MPPEVKVVRLPGLSEKGDIVDFIESRTASGQTPNEIRREIEQLIADAPFVTSVGSGGPAQRANEDAWPDPLPLPDDLPPVDPFDPALLPDSLRPWAEDIAERIQCPIDFIAVAAMVALSSLVGRTLGIRPKREDDWTVVPNLWGGVIGRPGVMKTPAITEPLKPVKAMEIEAKKAFDAKSKEREASKRVADVRKKDATTKIKKAISDKSEALRLAMESIADDGEEQITRKRYIVNDSSVEKLGEILNENPRGVLVFRDELVGFLKSLDKEGQEGARSFYLEAWNGNGHYTYDRIGRGTVDIEAAIVSVLGAIQPGPLRHYLRHASQGDAGDDGLVQRFQLLVWPDITRNWRNVDRPPNRAARDKAYLVFEGLDELDPPLVYADPDTQEPDGIHYLRFDDEAQTLFNAWREQLERIVRSAELPTALESHLAKYRSLVPSLALLIHLADGLQGPVGSIALDKAIRWAKYLESHARRVYAHVLQPDVAAAKALVARVRCGDIADGFAPREVYRKGWSGLSSREEVKGAVELLMDLGWLEEERAPTPGRTGTTYRINPKIWPDHGPKLTSSPVEPTDRTDGRGSRDPSGGSGSGQPGTTDGFRGDSAEEGDAQ
ncbi:MAG: DUF3987 domain-containing protein [Phycisphaerales bacterium]|nr:DUF3987 domain-containing protein [Phycisphaerales bacterium]